MAKRIAKFEKVSYEQFKKDYYELFGYRILNEEQVKEIYDKIELPTRATKGSAGYDFKSPFTFTLLPNDTIVIPTGIRAIMNPDWVLKCYPRSGLGFKHRTRLNNTVGIIDSDYAYSDNEGHIKIKISNECNNSSSLKIECGNGFAQGIFVEYGITLDDNVEDKRNGGFGSTTK